VTPRSRDIGIVDTHGASGTIDMSRMIARRRRRTVAGRGGWSMGGVEDTAHTGLLVVRVWREETNEDRVGIRARITSTVDVRFADDRTLLVTSADDLQEAVRGWLREYLAQ
jgi:hypothetical protein